MSYSYLQPEVNKKMYQQQLDKVEEVGEKMFYIILTSNGFVLAHNGVVEQDRNWAQVFIGYEEYKKACKIANGTYFMSHSKFVVPLRLDQERARVNWSQNGCYINNVVDKETLDAYVIEFSKQLEIESKGK